jgi:uncharacterized Zn finger protein (UPF0148 family)
VYWKFRELYESQEAQSTEAYQAEKPNQAQSTVAQMPTKVPEPIIEANKPLGMYAKAEIDRLSKFQARQDQAQSNEPKSRSAEEYLAKLNHQKASANVN